MEALNNKTETRKTKVMCRGSRKEVGTQFLAPCHQSMGFWHLLFCHWNCAMKWSCVIYSLYLVGGCWCRVELVSSGVGIKQRWEWQESPSLKATRRNREPPTPDVVWLSLNVSSLEKEPPHTHSCYDNSREWLATCASVWSPSAQLWKVYMNLGIV